MSEKKSCSTCNKTIESQGILVGGKAHHSDCFVCHKCRGSFDKPFVNVEGKSYHENCVPDNIEVLKPSDSKECKKCQKECGTGNVVQANHSVYHENCFTCGKCNKKIEAEDGKQGKFEISEGDIYHVSCVTPNCSVCKAQIKDKCTVIGNSNFCSNCAVCKKCGKNFGGSGVTKYENNMYHEACIDHHVSSNVGNCGICKKNLSDPAVEVEDKAYHKACFVCEKCKKPFDEEYCKVMGLFYHKGCDPK